MKCPECGEDTLINDPTTNQRVCTSCGYVDEEQLIDTGPEWRAYTQRDRLNKERIGAPLSDSIHDRGLTTRLDVSSKNRYISMKLKRIHEKTRVSNSDKKLVTLLSILNDQSAKMGLPDYVKNTASTILRKLVATKAANRIDKNTLVAASLYQACKINQIPRHHQEFKDKFSLERNEFWKAIKKVQSIKQISPDLKSKIKPNEYIPMVNTSLNLPQTVATKASQLVEKMYEDGMSSGKGYLALSAAAVYLISTLMDKKKTQKEIADALNITEVTIRNRYKDIVGAFDIEVKI
ncbi:transcription initiation factor IIB [Sulfuracidifex metallicus]|uniref:transcription initiation factor IIB n=1 Tax=Sulfuracidifex metallicus TaxID=47303 RepID=UPI002273AD8E|nr:transcription initiation factor IIB family protein [Sulfuracidifex metallicus]MCY0849573.1 transcription initiation factor IIB family protein [Sulfuracidifex metallicus]